MLWFYANVRVLQLVCYSRSVYIWS